MDLNLVFGVLKEGLKLWNTKEGNKYLDRVIKLESKYYDELKKPFHDPIRNANDDAKHFRSQLFLDECMLELNTIAKNFIQYSPKK